MFEVKECKDTDVVKVLFQEYSQIKGAESCFVSFDKELNDLETFYKGGALLVGYEEKLGLVSRFKTAKTKVERAIEFLDNGDTAAARQLLSEIDNDL